MLVLLIIVMLIAPLLQAGVPVRSPEATNTEEKTDNDEQTVVHVDQQGRFYVDIVLTEERSRLTVIQTALDRKLERLVLIKGDEGARYSGARYLEVMHVFDQLQRAGIENIGLIAERPGANVAGG